MDEVKSITDNDQRQLVSQLCLLYVVGKKKKETNNHYLLVLSKQGSLTKLP